MVTSLSELFAAFPMVDITAMGFPAHWQDEPLWKSEKA